nr:PREDICTED: muscle M-line assembly protein unc-89 isoform X2 [Bemisia tabaci]
MSTFCRITGRSRGLPKPNYFPLLPPISPADAKRFCKITGKAYGLPSHHFTPVLLGPRRNKVSHCHITEKSENQDPHHFFPGVEHTILVDYRYVIPTLDESQELIAILATKTVDSTKMYAYPVTDRNCSLVFPAKFEAAVRDGDVRDIMLAKDSDQVLLKLKKGLSVTVGFTEMRDVNEAELYEGAGPSEEVLNERKRKRRRTGGTANWMKEIFEKKERAAEEEEEALQMQKSKAVKVKISKESKTDPSPSEWKSVTVDKSISTRAVLSDTSTTALQEPIDVQNVEKLLEVKGTPVVTSLPKPITAQPECVDLKTSLPGIIQQPPAALTENTIGFETAPIAAPFKPLTAEPNAEVQQAIKDINVETLAETEFVAQVFDMDKTENFKKLPLKGEIAEIIENLHLGVEETLTDEQGHKINGLKLDIGAAQKFIAGQTVQTPSGKVFVPGQTVQTPAGPVFVPGLVLQTPDGPQLLPGQQVMVESNGVQTPVFVAGQTLPTRGGEKFVYGQMLSCEDGTKFVPGQTVYTPDGPIFVSGQVVEENDEVRFVPGQTVMSATGPTFVPGQNFQKGEQTVFVPGQTILDENKGWDFLPGQTFTAESGEMKFVPGQTLEIGNVKKFVPGQSVVDESGETQFVPGVAVQNADGVTEFLAGLTVDTPNGRQFLEGQIVRSESGICSFVPGKTTVSENGTKVQFAIAETVADLSFSETDPIGIETKASFFPTSESTDEVFGHMVQTAHGVEFFPGLAAGLPEGKVIPGKLTRGKEVRFVPGVVVNEKFVPGQVVQTDKGEQFIPGQVVETKDGAKFVPGQIVETRSGPKFVPGQTINTEDGPKFVPGQIVETRAGPTFIPGQIISTEEEGSRFVPGQVVETKEGPRFVPGRVIETGDCVTFVPGQVVETSEGLKFIAPDLQSSPEGDCEYTVQGFEVTPEELSILNLNALASQAASSAEMSINSEMLKQLSEAGMSIGRSVPTELPVVDVGTLPSMSAACSLSDKMKLDPVSTVKLSQVLSVVSTLTLNAETAEDASIAQTSESVVINKMLNKMKQYQEEESMDIIFEALSEVLEENMTGEGEEKKLQILDGLYKFISKSENIAPFQQPKKMLTLKNALNADIDKPEEIIEKLSSVLNDDEAAISSAFQHMTKNNPELLQKVVQHVNKSLKGVNVDKNASDILQKAIIDSVRESSIATVNEVLHSDDRNEFKQLILQAVGLARALGMTPVVDVLIDVITDQKSAEVLSEDPVTIEILRRLTIMKQLAEERPTFGTALKQLQSDPELARTDPRLRQLVRESAALMIIPEESVLHSSSDIPTALFHPSNSLAMEDFLARQKHRDPLLIIKHGLQAVVPREVAHSVLTGQVPYTVLDEKGISHFEPMHVLSALRLPKHATHWFSMYACTMQLDDEESTLASSLSVEDLRRPSLEMRRISVDKLKKPPKLVNGHGEKTRDDRAKSSSSDDATLNNLDDLRRGSTGDVRKRVVNGSSQQNGERAKSSSSDDATLVETMDCFRKPSIDSFLDAELLTNKLANGHADPYELKGVRLVRDFDANDEQCSEEHSLVNGQSKIISPEDLRRKSFDYLKTYGTYKKRRSSRHLNGTLQSTRDIYLVIEDYVPNRIEEITLHKGDLVVVIDTGEELEEEPKRPRLETEVELTPGTELTGAAFLDSSAAKHKLSVRPPDRRPSLKGRSRSASPAPPAVNARWMVQSIKDPTKQGWIPAKILRLEQKAEIPADDQTIHEAHFQREAVIRELVETEEEFGRDIRRVVERYLKPLDNNSVPRIIRDNKDLIFGNLKQISDFHNTVLIEGVKYYANEPRLLGKTFLRLERDFDKHVTYCRDEPAAQEFLNENTDVRDYFGEVGHRLADDKSLSEHLKLPIQRINDYQLLLKELVKLSNLLGEDTTDLNRALELMLAVPHRANDNKFIGNIEGYHGNIHKLGRLLRHDWFRISHKDGKSKERYLFLFKARILVCKVRRISQDRSVFVLKDIIRLPEVEVKDHPDDSLVFELHSKIPSNGEYPLTITAHKDNVKFSWLNEIRLYSADVLALAEHAADDLRLQEKEDDKHFEPLKGVELEITPDIELEPFVAPPTAKPLRHVPEPKRPPLEAPKKSVLRVGGNTEDKENQEFIEAEQRPSITEQRPSITEHRSSISEHRSSISERRPSITEHRPSIGEVVISESSKSVQEVRSSQYIQEEESKMSIRSVKTSEYRSVTSSVSEEVYMETSSNQMEQVASSTSSSSRSYKKMEHSVDGKTISHVEEISSTQGGYGDLSGGGGAIDRRQSLLSIQELVSARRSSQVDSLASSASSLFSKPIAGSAVEPGDNAVFEVAIDSSEVTTLSWLKDNKILSDKLADRISATNTDSNFKLEIMNVRPSDSGTYTARASDSSGTVSSCTAQLIVEELTPEEKKRRLECNNPVFLVRLKDTEVLENTFLRFIIKVRGSPMPSVTFFKNGELIHNFEENVKIIEDKSDSGFYELVILNVKPSDAGTYKCIASNEYGEESCEAKLSVTDDKDIWAEFETGGLQPGEKPVFSWFRDGVPFDPKERFSIAYKDKEDSLQMEFKNVTPEDAGLYTCVAATNSGKIACSAELTVQGASSFTGTPVKPEIKPVEKRVEVTLDETAMVEAKISGAPKPKITWSKDGQEITAGGRFKFLWEDEETMALVIKNVCQDDAGDYVVNAHNESGVDTQVIKLVIRAGAKFRSYWEDHTIMENHEIKLSIGLDGAPTPGVIWYKDGKVINSSDRVKLSYDEESTTHTLYIQRASMEDTGSYSIIATNELSQDSAFSKIQVMAGPRFTKEMPKAMTTKEGDNVTFQVKVKGDPEPEVKWFFNNVEITEKNTEFERTEEGPDRENVTMYKLILKDATIDKAGAYRCKVSNDLGGKETNCALTVKCKPKIKKELEDLVIDEGDTLNLTIECFGVPEPEITWYRNGQEVTGDSRITISRDKKRVEEYNLSVTLTKSEDGGEYEVRATNEMGTSVTKSYVTVHSKSSTDEKTEEEVRKQSTTEITDELTEKITKEEDNNEEVKIKNKINKEKTEDKNEVSPKIEEPQTPIRTGPDGFLRRKKLIIENLGDEGSYPRTSSPSEKDAFSCVEMQYERLTSTDLASSSKGIVEEPAEEHIIKVSVQRGVSIVSVHESDSSFSRQISLDNDNSLENIPEFENSVKRTKQVSWSILEDEHPALAANKSDLIINDESSSVKNIKVCRVEVEENSTGKTKHQNIVYETTKIESQDEQQTKPNGPLTNGKAEETMDLNEKHEERRSSVIERLLNRKRSSILNDEENNPLVFSSQRTSTSSEVEESDKRSRKTSSVFEDDKNTVINNESDTPKKSSVEEDRPRPRDRKISSIKKSVSINDDEKSAVSSNTTSRRSSLLRNENEGNSQSRKSSFAKDSNDEHVRRRSSVLKDLEDKPLSSRNSSISNDEDEPLASRKSSILTDENKPYSSRKSSILNDENKPLTPRKSSILNDEDKPLSSRKSSILNDEDKPLSSRKSSILNDEDKPLSSRKSSILKDEDKPLTSRKSSILNDEDKPLSSRKSSILNDEDKPLSSRKSSILKDEDKPLSSRKSSLITDEDKPLSSRKSSIFNDEDKPLSSRKSSILTEEDKPLYSRKSSILKDEDKPLSSRKSSMISDEDKPLSSRKSSILNDEDKPFSSRKSSILIDEDKPVPPRKSSILTDEDKPFSRRKSSILNDEDKPFSPSSRKSSLFTDDERTIRKSSILNDDNDEEPVSVSERRKSSVLTNGDDKQADSRKSSIFDEGKKDDSPSLSRKYGVVSNEYEKHSASRKPALLDDAGDDNKSPSSRKSSTLQDVDDKPLSRKSSVFDDEEKHPTSLDRRNSSLSKDLSRDSILDDKEMTASERRRSSVLNNENESPSFSRKTSTDRSSVSRNDEDSPYSPFIRRRSSILKDDSDTPTAATRRRSSALADDESKTPLSRKSSVMKEEDDKPVFQRQSSVINEDKPFTSTERRSSALKNTDDEPYSSRRSSILKDDEDKPFSIGRRRSSALKTYSDESAPARKSSILENDDSSERKLSVLSTGDNDTPSRKSSLIDNDDKSYSPRRRSSILKNDEDKPYSRRKSSVLNNDDDKPYRRRSSAATEDGGSRKASVSKNDEDSPYSTFIRRRSSILKDTSDIPKSPDRRSSILTNDDEKPNSLQRRSSELKDDDKFSSYSRRSSVLKDNEEPKSATFSDEKSPERRMSVFKDGNEKPLKSTPVDTNDVKPSERRSSVMKDDDTQVISPSSRRLSGLKDDKEKSPVFSDSRRSSTLSASTFESTPVDKESTTPSTLKIKDVDEKPCSANHSESGGSEFSDEESKGKEEVENVAPRKKSSVSFNESEYAPSEEQSPNKMKGVSEKSLQRESSSLKEDEINGRDTSPAEWSPVLNDEDSKPAQDSRKNSRSSISNDQIHNLEKKLSLSKGTRKPSEVDAKIEDNNVLSDVEKPSTEPDTKEKSEISTKRKSSLDDKATGKKESAVGKKKSVSKPEEKENIPDETPPSSLIEKIERRKSLLNDIINENSDIPQETTRKPSKTQVAPQILSSTLKDKDVYESLPNKFEIVASAEPRPEVKWLKDGEEISPSDTHTVLTKDGDTHRLEILATEQADAGVYTCKVTNRLGEVAESGTLNILPESLYRCPKVKVPIQDTRCPKHQSGSIAAVFTADPIPEFKWTREGKEVHAESNFTVKEEEYGLKECTVTLTIPRSEHRDTGLYTVTATNKYGIGESTGRYDVVFKPEITTFCDIMSPPQAQVVLSAHIHANPKPEISWIIEDEKIDIKADERLRSERDEEKEIYSLVINDTKRTDENMYTVVATNEFGESTKSARLRVQTDEPSFVKVLQDQTIKDYEYAEIKARAYGIPKPIITWWKDGEEVVPDDNISITVDYEGQTNSTLAFKHFREKNVGKYVAKAWNIAGEAKSNCRMKMFNILPSFSTTLSRSVELTEKEPLELRAKADGSPAPSIKWFKDGEPLEADDRVKIWSTPDGWQFLKIESTVPSDSGSYKIVATNQTGDCATTCGVGVNPEPMAPVFKKELSDAFAVEGGVLKLEAFIAGVPTPETKWLKDGIEIHPTPAINFVTAPNGEVGLEIEPAKMEDNGVYTLLVANRLGKIESTARGEVIYKEIKPKFNTHLLPLSLVEGFPARLEVQIEGHPEPEVIWFKDDMPLAIDGTRIKVVSSPDGTQALVIEDATPSDSGLYGVVAKNELGSSKTEAPLEILPRERGDVPEERPQFLHSMRDTTTDEGSSLSLVAPFIGNPIPEVLWHKDGQVIHPSERIRFYCDAHKVGLEIPKADLADAGVYSVFLKNCHGEATTAGKANVRKLYQAPTFIQRFTDLQQMPGYNAKFLARVTGIPTPDVAWYHDLRGIYDGGQGGKYRIKREGEVCCLYINNLDINDAGWYKCEATNKEGHADCDAALQVVDRIKRTPKIEPPSFLKRIGDCEIFRGMAAKFTACVTGYPEPYYEWYKSDERLFASDRIKMEREGTGILRLIINRVVPEHDLTTYKLRIYNDYGEATCEANLLLDSIEESRARKPVGDQYTDFTNYRNTGAPLPLADRPIISRMMDRRLTLSWRPSLPIGPRFPVTYHVEMAVQPDGDWFTARTGVRSCVCEISNLEPFRDYKFRVRVENKYGISDPSPFGMTHRGRLELPPPKLWDYLPPGIEFRPESSPYFPKDFDIERPPHDNYFQAPRFLRQEHETQYCVKGHNCNLFWFVYGYPKPKMTYFFNDEPIEMGGRYDCSYTRNGQATLFINRMLERDEGMYEAVATNEHGQARQRVRLRCAEYPVFIKRPEETYVMMRRSCRLEAKITGVPYPDIKWFKDWQPLAPSSRVRIQHIEPDTCVLVIADVILKDQGLYSISARNVAGSISTSVSLHVEESEGQFSFHSYSRFPHAKLKTRKATDLYDLGDELGRGTQGITYHAVERITGRNFAAKVMTGTKDYRFDMTEEFEVMNNLNHRNLIRLYEGYETTKTITIITELASGGELLDVLTRQTHVTEAEIAYYIRQILWGIEHMHHNSFAHLGLTPGDLLISHIGGDELKISDFGCSRKINYGKFHPLYYGMPEFVAPEVVRGDGVYFPADMWSIGVITHLFLTGVSLFRGRDDQETLLRIKNNQYQLSSSLSENARDFISKLLLIDTEARMDIKNALRHPWLNLADKPLSDPDHYEISTDCLRNYYNSYKDWYSNASCRTWYRRRKLETAFTHPSRMVYPPGHSYTPESTPPPQSKLPPHRTWEDQIPSREPIDVDIGMIKNESHYQYGPDTYLLQLRDVDFPVRLREYMKVAANRAPRLSQVFDHECHLDWRMPIIRERRRFTDVMDEEIDDERKARINRYGNFESLSTRRLRNEVGMRPDTRVEAEALMDAKREGQPPFFREKPQITPIFGNKVCDISYFVVGDPEPTIQWFKNDLVLTEGKRVKFLRDDEGRSVLRLNPALEYDVGTFKCVARNKCGQTVARMRLVAGGPPDAPDSPIAVETSDTEVLLRWKQPKEDGHAEVVCYRLQYKESHNPDWEDICSTINHEFWLVKNLKPNSNYLFRLAARNCHGWSKPGIPSEHITTEKEDTPKIVITVAMKHMQTMSESGRDIYEDEDELKLDYKVEREPIQWIDSLPTDNYRFLSEIFRGRFSVVVKGVRIEDERTVVAKLLEVNEKTEKQVMKEFENLRSLRHVRIAALLEAYKPSSHPGLVVFILEKLQGADILTALSSRHEYSEQVVMTVVSQLLDAVQYLHWRGLAHLDIQPDNVVMATTRSTQVKLVDFAATHYVSKLGTMVNPSNTCLDYDSPEVLCDEPAFPQSDIWSIGVLAYVLLSGKSPFRGENDQETRQNIIFVRYRFEHLYKELSQEATRFLMLIFKRSPCKRPTAEECQEHRWLSPTEFMIKKRERANFLGMRLKEYAEFYHNQRSAETLKSDLKSVLAVKATVSRSDSIQEELSSTYDDSHLCHPLII